MTVRITIEVDADDERAHTLLRSLAAALGGEAPAEATFDEGLFVESEAAPERKRSARRQRAPRGGGVIALARKLRADGYFEQARSARDVRTELLQRGFKFDSRQVYATLNYLTRKNLLQRQGSRGAYVYIAIAS